MFPLLLVTTLHAATFEDDFEDGNMEGWSVVDGVWKVQGGAMVGSGTEIGPDVLVEPGLGGVDTYTVRLTAQGTDSIGIVLAYAGPDEHCGVLFASDGKMYLVDGSGMDQRTGTSWIPDHEYKFKIDVTGDSVAIYRDGTYQWDGDANCGDFEPSGQVGVQVGEGTLTVASFSVEWQAQDSDGDGVDDLEDCKPDDATISRETRESWYDGIDNDCVGDDDYDADKDGFVPDEYVGLTTFEVPGSGELPGGDCDDDDDDAWPGGPEIWYDGTDGDCDGANDFDQDKDGVEIGEDGEGDCNDADATQYPGNTVSENDGVDHDCDGTVERTGDGGDSAAEADSEEQWGTPPSEECACAAGEGTKAIAGLLMLAALARRSGR